MLTPSSHVSGTLHVGRRGGGAVHQPALPRLQRPRPRQAEDNPRPPARRQAPGQNCLLQVCSTQLVVMYGT